MKTKQHVGFQSAIPYFATGDFVILRWVERYSYPVSGNVGNESPTYRWTLLHNGKIVDTFSRLRDAKAWMAEF